MVALPGFILFYFNLHLRTCLLILERKEVGRWERERERKRNIDQLSPIRALTRDWTHNLSGAWDNTPTNWATRNCPKGQLCHDLMKRERQQNIEKSISFCKRVAYSVVGGTVVIHRWLSVSYSFSCHSEIYALRNNSDFLCSNHIGIWKLEFSFYPPLPPIASALFSLPQWPCYLCMSPHWALLYF